MSRTVWMNKVRGCIAEATSPGEEVKFLAILIEEAVAAEQARCVKLVEAAGKKMWSTGYSRDHAELVAAIERGEP